METENTIRNKGLAMVFSMHKVGSSTVMQAFRDIGRVPERGFAENREHLQPLENYEAVVTPVRDPIARNISYFFEMFGDELVTLHYHFGFESLMETYHARIDHTYPLRWFDEVFQPTFGVNVYATRFAKKRGWSILGNHYLLIQTERMLNSMQAGFMELFGRRPGKLHRAKTVETRPYGKVYDEFVKKAKFSEEYVEQMLESKYVKHFYLKRQVDEMRMRWQKK